MNENDLKTLNLCVVAETIKSVEITDDNELLINFEDGSDIIIGQNVFGKWFFKY